MENPGGPDFAPVSAEEICWTWLGWVTLLEGDTMQRPGTSQGCGAVLPVLPGQNPCASPAAMLLGELPSPSSLAGLGTVWGAGMAVGGKPSIHTAQRIACSQGLVCAEPTLRWQWGNSQLHCPPVTATSPWKEAEICPFLQGLRVSVRLQP